VTVNLAPGIAEGFADINQAAAIGKVSVKTIRNWDARQTIGSQIHKRPGVSPIKIYNVADIEREASKQNGIQARVEKSPVTDVAKVTEKRTSPVPEKLLEVLNGMLERLESLPKLLPAAENQRDVLTIDEAIARGYQRSWIRKQMREGKLTKVGRGRVSRFELEKLAGKG
jgi:hypothetical protein